MALDRDDTLTGYDHLLNLAAQVGDRNAYPFRGCQRSGNSGRGDRIRTCLNSFWRRAPFPSGHHPLWRSQRELNPSLLIDSQASCR